MEDKIGEKTRYKKIDEIYQRTRKEIKKVTGMEKFILIIQEDKNTRCNFTKGFSKKELARMSLDAIQNYIYTQKD